MPEDGYNELRERVARLETQMVGLEKGEVACQERTAKAIDSLTSKVDKLISNELVHINERLSISEKRTAYISPGDWVKIITTAIIVAGSIIVAYIQFGGR